MSLHTTELGDQGPRLVFCHGLFGQGKNWTQIAKAFADRHRVTLVDMPHHGRSSWSDSFSYADVADQVAALIDDADPVTLVGHSMGGKAAMVLALRHPRLVSRLCVVDVSPVAYAHGSEFREYVRAMQALDLAALESRSDADRALAPAVQSPTVRSFLLQNLRRDPGGEGRGWSWQPNLEVLGRDLDAVAGWPEEEVSGAAPYDGPVLWVAGATSPYVGPEHAPVMEQLFPRVRRVTVKGAGHWVHSEQPEIFVQVLRRFVE
ncbi:MAG: Hydrolase, alpha/beta fold family [uncultured Nocardioides sp.]|uniref:Hydrolase, alpha/beta fold family n=1 Tax=uncultured Nocardioides sp. TaxID=198441 RepID=A0A6J4NDR1_9ACTN|nr:MAG: Hydrolase, alpha/beta fold family [uncultured Nocardioides sp.]